MEMLDPELDNVNALIFKLDELSRHYKTSPPSKKELLLTALKLENSSGEYYFQIVLSMPVEKAAVMIMRSLAEGEKDHASKIIANINEQWTLAA